LGVAAGATSTPACCWSTPASPPAATSSDSWRAGAPRRGARTAFLDAPRLALKWPNDLLVGPAKAAGILVEGHRLAEGAFAVVIGIGADVAHAPEGLAYPTAALGAHAPGLDAGTLFSALAGAFAERHAQWAAGEASRRCGATGSPARRASGGS
jgi:biotin-(acetyl-CoA carboxylase) ligase